MFSYEVIYRACEFIEDNLKNFLTVKIISDKVGYSLFHFTRMFNSVIKHNPYDYLIRRRLSEAAKELMNSNKKIIDIAFDYKFNTHETFSRAFKKMFGILPNQIRKKNINDFNLKNKINIDYIKHINIPGQLRPEKSKLEQLHLTGIMNSYNNIASIKEIIQLFKDELEDNKIKLKNKDLYILKIKSNINNYFFTGISEKNTERQYQFVRKIIPSRNIIKFNHLGSSEELKYSYQYIFETWLPKAKINIDKNLLIEKININNNLKENNISILLSVID